MHAHGAVGAIGKVEAILHVGVEERREGRLRHLLGDAHGESAAHLVPAHLEAGVAPPPEPLLEKVAQRPARLGLKHPLHIGGAGRGVAELLLVGAQRAEKLGVVVQQKAQRVHHARALLIAEQVIENPVHIGSIGHVHAAVAELGVLVGGVHPGAGRGGRAESLQRQVLPVGGEALIQPDIFPAGAGYVIAEPLVKQLVRREGEVEPVLGGHGLVLHAAAERGHSMAILLIRKGIKPDQRREVLNEAGRPVDFGLVEAQCPLVVHVVDDGHAGAADGVGVVDVLQIGRDGHRNEVVGNGMARLPLVTHPVVGQGRGAHQHPIRAHFVGQRGRHPHVAGVGLVGQHLLTRKPLVRRVGLRQAPGDVVRVAGGAHAHGIGGAQRVADGGGVAARGRAVVIDNGINERPGGGGLRQAHGRVVAPPPDARRIHAIDGDAVDGERGRAGGRPGRGLVQLKAQRVEPLAAGLHPHPHRAGHVARGVFHGQVQLVIFHVVALHQGAVRYRGGGQALGRRPNVAVGATAGGVAGQVGGRNGEIGAAGAGQLLGGRAGGWG